MYCVTRTSARNKEIMSMQNNFNCRVKNNKASELICQAVILIDIKEGLDGGRVLVFTYH